MKIAIISALFIILVVLIYIRYSVDETNEPIDVVYTWVNGNDPVHKRKRENHINGEKNKMKNIYLSNANTQFNDYDTLKYSVRSILKYAPWVRRIYIVTDNQQPNWFKEGNNKVFIIDHKQIIPERFLPTFNSHVIEYHLHNIPNLSDNFLYLNDDTMLGNYVKTCDFLNRKQIYLRTNGKRVPDKINFTNNYISSWVNANRILNRDYKKERREFLLHQATICNRTVMKNLIKEYKDEYEKTSNTKFRNKLNVPPVGLSLYYGLYKGYVKLNKGNISNHYFKLNNDINYNRNNFNEILRRRPKLICINDANNFKPTNKQIELLTNFLEMYYPEKSVCEK